MRAMQRSRRRFALGLAGLGLVGLPRPAFGREPDVSARLSVDRTKVRAGEPVLLTLVIEARNGTDLPEPRVPETWTEAMEILASSQQQSSSTQIVNGRMSSVRRRVIRVEAAPRQVGTLRLSYVAGQGSEAATSNVLELEVLEPGAELPEDPRVPSEPRGDVFPWASAEPRQVYVGEQVVYNLDIYERRTMFSVQLRTPPSFKDFFTKELPTDEARIVAIDGVRYQVEPGIKRALFPQRAGTLTIGAAEITVGMRGRIQSQDLQVEVAPLPAEGQPEDFSPNNVGNYEISASVDRTEVEPGQPFTLEVMIEGTGNIDVVDPGAWPTVSGVRRYDPKIDTEHRVGERFGGTRRYSFLMIPERGGTLEIPPHSLSFFDPEAEAYRTVETDPITVQVAGGGEVLEEQADEENADEAEEREALAGIIAMDSVPRDQPRERWLTARKWVWGMVAVPTLAAGGWGAAFAWRKLGPDDAARERATRRSRRRATIDAARARVQSGEGFHTQVAGLLQDVAMERAGPEGVGLPRPELVDLLRRRSVADADVDRLERLLEECDAVRFGAAKGSEAERQALLDEALELVRRSSLSKGVAV